MPRIPDTEHSSSLRSMTNSLRPRKLGRVIMKSHRITLTRFAQLPVRIRPWFLVFSCLVIVILALLGFTDFANSLPLNHKILRFLCMGVATGVLYWVFDVEEEARRIWFWRHSALIFTGIICFFFGGIVSEVVHSMLPYKHFEIGDVIANLAGSGCGLTISYYLERYYRHRREISRLYVPMNATNDGSDDEEDSALLPTHNKAHGSIRLGNVWDETDEGLRTGYEIFAIGDEDDLSASLRMTPAPGAAAWGGGVRTAHPTVPKTAPVNNAPRIVVTAPSTASLPISGDVS